MVLRCDLVSHFLTEIWDAGIKKAGIFYLTFSQKKGINILGIPLWRSYQGFLQCFDTVGLLTGRAPKP